MLFPSYEHLLPAAEREVLRILVNCPQRLSFGVSFGLLADFPPPSPLPPPFTLVGIDPVL